MGRRREDEIDGACHVWAAERVRLFAQDPARAHEYIGPLGCTLGVIKRLHDGAGATTQRGSQNWPPVYSQTGVVVWRAYQGMSETLREVLHRNYIERWYDDRHRNPAGEFVKKRYPTKSGVIAERMGLSPVEYSRRVNVARECVRTLLNVPELLGN